MYFGIDTVVAIVGILLAIAVIVLALTTLGYVQANRLLMRDYLREQFGIEYELTDSLPEPALRVVDAERARPKTLFEVAHRCDLIIRCKIYDTAWLAISHERDQPFRALLAKVVAAKWWVKKYRIVMPGISLEEWAVAHLRAYLYVMRDAPLMYAPLALYLGDSAIEERIKEGTIGVLSAWVRSRIKMYSSLRQALAKEGPPYQVLISELPGEVLSELRKPETYQPRPEGAIEHLDSLEGRSVHKRLVNRVSGNLRDPSRRNREKESKDLSEDVEYAKFAAGEALLRRGRAVGLPPREYELLKLYALIDPEMPHAEAAERLGVAVGTVKSLKHKIKKSLDVA